MIKKKLAFYFVASLVLSLTIACGLPIHAKAATVTVGARVQLTASATTYSAPSGVSIGSHLKSDAGTVLETYSTSWARVDFDSGVDGWVKTSYLVIPLPDLVVTELQATTTFAPNGLMGVDFAVKNASAAFSPDFDVLVSARYIVGNGSTTPSENAHVFHVYSLAPGASATYRALNVPLGQNQKIKLVVDPANEVIESKETNNTTSTWVGTPHTPLSVSIIFPTSSPTYSTSLDTINVSGVVSGNVGDAFVSVVNTDNIVSSYVTPSLYGYASSIPLDMGPNYITYTAYDSIWNTGFDTIVITRTASSTGMITPTPTAALPSSASELASILDSAKATLQSLLQKISGQ